MYRSNNLQNVARCCLIWIYHYIIQLSFLSAVFHLLCFVVVVFLFKYLFVCFFSPFFPSQQCLKFYSESKFTMWRNPTWLARFYTLMWNLCASFQWWQKLALFLHTVQNDRLYLCLQIHLFIEYECKQMYNKRSI